MGLVLTDRALLIPAFALVRAPPVLAVGLLRTHNAPLPTRLPLFHGFGKRLEPRDVVGAPALDQ